MQQYAFIVPVIIVIWVFLVTIRVGAYLNSKNIKNAPKTVPEKVCPPHKWRWEEQPGIENVTYMWCLTCKKTPRQVSEGT